MPRRTVTETTLALYHFEEASHLNWLFMLDSSGNGRNLSNAGYTSGTPTTAQKRDCPKPVNIVNAFGKGKRARWFTADTNLSSMSGTGTAGDLAATFQGQHTFKCFLRVDSLAAKRCVYAYSDDGESTATNTQFSLLINTDGTLEVLTEDGAGGTNRVHTSASAVVTAGVLYMVHVVKNGTHYRFYLDGVFKDQVAILAQPDGGTTCQSQLGRNLPTATQRFVGAIRGAMIRSTAESDGDITAQVGLLGSASVDGTLTFTDSTNVVRHWIGDEAPDAIDECERGMHLCQASTGGSILAAVPFVQPTRLASKYWGSTSFAELIACGNVAATTTAEVEPNALALQNELNIGDWSIALEFRAGDGATGAHGLVLVGSATGSDTSASENFMGFGLNNTEDIRYGHEYQQPSPPVTGVDSVLQVASALGTSQLHGINHLVITRRASDGRTRMYLNKTKIGEDVFADIDIGDAAYLRLAQGTLNSTWFGQIGPVVIDATEWDQAAVDADYELMFSERDATAPVIENVVYPDSPDDWLEFDVYDTSPGLSLNCVLIQLGNEAIREAAYDEGEFRGRYLAGGSTITGSGTSGDPYHFKLHPAGDWPEGVLHNLLPRFGDGSGNFQFGPA